MSSSNLSTRNRFAAAFLRKTNGANNSDPNSNATWIGAPPLRGAIFWPIAEVAVRVIAVVRAVPEPSAVTVAGLNAQCR